MVCVYIYISTSDRVDSLLDTVDGCEIVHELIDGKHPILDRVEEPSKVVQDFFQSIN